MKITKILFPKAIINHSEIVFFVAKCYLTNWKSMGKYMEDIMSKIKLFCGI
jgi:hypothetical protein